MPFAGNRRLNMLLLVWLLLSLLRIALMQWARFPLVFDDELEYWRFGHQILHGQFAFTYRGVLWHYPDYAYPALIAFLAHLSTDLRVQYAIVRVFNGFMMSAVVFPTYALGSDLGLRPRSALWVAILAGLVSGGAYAGSILAEPLYYPLFVTLIWLLWRLAKRPGLALGGLCGLLLGVLCFVKPQTYMLYPIGLALAVLVHVQRPDLRRVLWRTVAVLLAASLSVLATRFLIAAHEGYHHLFTLHAFLGYYAKQGTTSLAPPLSLELKYLLAYAVIFILIGAGAPLYVLVRRARQRFGDASFWLLTGSCTAILLLYFSRNTVLYNVLNLNPTMHFTSARAMERYLFPVLPLWFIGLGLAYEGNVAPSSNHENARSLWWFGSLLLLTGILAELLLPQFFGQLLTFDSPGLSIFWTLDKVSPWLFAAGLVAALALIFEGQRRHAPMLLAALLLLLTLGWYPSIYGTNSGSNAAEANSFVPFLNRHVPKGAFLAFDGSVDSGIAHNILFWSMHPWVWVGNNRAPSSHPCAYVITSSASAKALGPSKDGLTILAPRHCP